MDQSDLGINIILKVCQAREVCKLERVAVHVVLDFSRAPYAGFPCFVKSYFI